MRTPASLFLACILLCSTAAKAELRLPISRRTEEMRSLRESAEQGSLQAQQELCLRTQLDLAVRGDSRNVDNGCKAAALQGDPYAEGSIAFDNKDYKTALELWQPLADQGYAVAQWRIGDMYLADHNPLEALKWYRKAAELGDPTAPRLLANIYESGDRGVAPDRAEAAKWYRIAADRGDGQAAFHLINLYEDKRAWFWHDYENAYFWEIIAEKLNPGFHRDFRTINAVSMDTTSQHLPEEHLSSDTRTSIEKRAAEWKASAVPLFIVYPTAPDPALPPPIKQEK